jgi:hypothetical protein
MVGMARTIFLRRVARNQSLMHHSSHLSDCVPVDEDWTEVFLPSINAYITPLLNPRRTVSAPEDGCLCCQIGQHQVSVTTVVAVIELLMSIRK